MIGWVRRGKRVKHFKIVGDYITVPKGSSPTAVLSWLGCRVEVGKGRLCWCKILKPKGEKLLTRCKYYKIKGGVNHLRILKYLNKGKNVGYIKTCKPV